MLISSLMTAAAGVVSGSFTIAAVSNAAVSSLIVSAPVTPTGFAASTSIAVTGSGSLISVNGDTYAASATISPGQSFTVELTSSVTLSTTLIATVVIGGVSAVFSVTTTAVSTFVSMNALPALPPYVMST